MSFKNTRWVLGTCSKQRNENSSELSECHFWILLDSTRSKIVFQDKISGERVESSKMGTLLGSTKENKINKYHDGVNDKPSEW